MTTPTTTVPTEPTFYATEPVSAGGGAYWQADIECAGGDYTAAEVYGDDRDQVVRRCTKVLAGLNAAAPDYESLVQDIAATRLEDIDLEYTGTNLQYGRGALDKKTKTEAIIAVRTLRAILQSARYRFPDQPRLAAKAEAPSEGVEP